jgi:hypothetical protein
VDFDFLQKLYEKAPPSDYKQKLWNVIDTSINGRQLTNQHPVTSQHNTLTTNLHMTSEMDVSSSVATAGGTKGIQKPPVPTNPQYEVLCYTTAYT